METVAAKRAAEFVEEEELEKYRRRSEAAREKKWQEPDRLVREREEEAQKLEQEKEEQIERWRMEYREPIDHHEFRKARDFITEH
jgi:hypothetical protein